MKTPAQSNHRIQCSRICQGPPLAFSVPTSLDAKPRKSNVVKGTTLDLLALPQDSPFADEYQSRGGISESTKEMSSVVGIFSYISGLVASGTDGRTEFSPTDAYEATPSTT